MKKKVIMSALLTTVLLFSSVTASAASTLLTFSFYGASDVRPLTSAGSFTMNGSQTGKLNIKLRWNYFVKNGAIYKDGACGNFHVNYLKGKTVIKTTTLSAVPRGNAYKSYSVSTSKLPKGTYKLEFKAACKNSVFDGYGTVTR